MDIKKTNKQKRLLCIFPVFISHQKMTSTPLWQDNGQIICMFSHVCNSYTQNHSFSVFFPNWVFIVQKTTLCCTPQKNCEEGRFQWISCYVFFFFFTTIRQEKSIILNLHPISLSIYLQALRCTCCTLPVNNQTCLSLVIMDIYFTINFNLVHFFKQVQTAVSYMDKNITHKRHTSTQKHIQNLHKSLSLHLWWQSHHRRPGVTHESK